MKTQNEVSAAFSDLALVLHSAANDAEKFAAGILRMPYSTFEAAHSHIEQSATGSKAVESETSFTPPL